MSALRFYRLGATSYEVRFYGRFVGRVERARSGWRAVNVERDVFPELFSSRRVAGERLQRCFESRRAAA